MRAASFSLALTALYALTAAYAHEAARAAGPVYALAVVGLFLIARRTRPCA